MNNIAIKILSVLVWLLSYQYLQAANLDSLEVIDAQYDSVLHSDEMELNTLFYKHQNNIRMNNLGPFGSPQYYATVFDLKNINWLNKSDLKFAYSPK